MCTDMGRVKFMFEVRCKDKDYFYCVPGSCVQLEGDRTTTSELRRFRVDLCRELTILEEAVYENCYSI